MYNLLTYFGSRQKYQRPKQNMREKSFATTKKSIRVLLSVYAACKMIQNSYSCDESGKKLMWHLSSSSFRDPFVKMDCNPTVGFFYIVENDSWPHCCLLLTGLFISVVVYIFTHTQHKPNNATLFYFIFMFICSNNKVNDIAVSVFYVFRSEIYRKLKRGEKLDKVVAAGLKNEWFKCIAVCMCCCVFLFWYMTIFWKDYLVEEFTPKQISRDKYEERYVYAEFYHMVDSWNVLFIKFCTSRLDAHITHTYKHYTAHEHTNSSFLSMVYGKLMIHMYRGATWI